MPPGFRTRATSAAARAGSRRCSKTLESEDAVKTPISKRQLMRVADDIGVFENLVLEFDASWVFLWGRTRTDVKNNAIAFAQDLFEISADGVGYVVGGNGDYVFLDEKRHFILIR